MMNVNVINKNQDDNVKSAYEKENIFYLHAGVVSSPGAVVVLSCKFCRGCISSTLVDISLSIFYVWQCLRMGVVLFMMMSFVYLNFLFGLLY